MLYSFWYIGEFLYFKKGGAHQNEPKKNFLHIQRVAKEGFFYEAAKFKKSFLIVSAMPPSRCFTHNPSNRVNGSYPLCPPLGLSIITQVVYVRLTSNFLCVYFEQLSIKCLKKTFFSTKMFRGTCGGQICFQNFTIFQH